MSGPDVLELLSGVAEMLGRHRYSATANDLLAARAAVAELIEAADALRSATGKSCSSWPIGSPQRKAWDALDKALRAAVAADPFNGTTTSAVDAALARIGGAP